MSDITPEAVDAATEAALAAVAAAATVSELKLARAEHTGEQSPLAQFNAAIKGLPNDQKAAAGKLVGEARGRVTTAVAEREAELAVAEETQRLADEAVDVTAVPLRWKKGARHPLSLLIEDMGDIFVAMGWEVAEGPELENEWFNFDSMNFDEDHPARAMQDTFFVDPVDSHLLLRTHTIPVQMRSLLARLLRL